MKFSCDAPVVPEYTLRLSIPGIHAHKGMNVITHAVDDIQFMSVLNNNSIHVFVQIIFEIILDQTQPVLHSKNIMNEQLGICISH